MQMKYTLLSIHADFEYFRYHNVGHTDQAGVVSMSNLNIFLYTSVRSRPMPSVKPYGISKQRMPNDSDSNVSYLNLQR
jgi:hypothetical protein